MQRRLTKPNARRLTTARTSVFKTTYSVAKKLPDVNPLKSGWYIDYHEKYKILLPSVP